jgi:signal transduction histidine kinase
LTIEDDGEGVAVDSLAPGIGLTNTRARLRQLYGAQHRVTMRSASGEGFAVELQLPLRFAHA